MPETMDILAKEIRGVSDLCIEIKGKLDRVNDAQKRTDDDMKALRQNQHDTNNLITPLIALNLPDRIKDLENIKEVVAQTKGERTITRAIWGFAGVSFGGFGLWVLEHIMK